MFFALDFFQHSGFLPVFLFWDVVTVCQPSQFAKGRRVGTWCKSCCIPQLLKSDPGLLSEKCRTEDEMNLSFWGICWWRYPGRNELSVWIMLPEQQWKLFYNLMKVEFVIVLGMLREKMQPITLVRGNGSFVNIENLACLSRFSASGFYNLHFKIRGDILLETFIVVFWWIWFILLFLPNQEAISDIWKC